ncbi:MAG: RNA polymerase sigma factor [Gaiellales bacterium]
MRDPPLIHADDGHLARLARGGDRDAYAELVRRHQTVAVRVAAQVGNVAIAEDAAQDAFVKAFVALPRFDPARPFRPWLLTIVANEARTRVRSRRRGARLDELLAARDDEPPGDPVADAVLARSEGDALGRALAALGEPDREILVLRFVLDLGERETAAVLGCRKGTVKSRTSRALSRLRAAFTEVTE